MKWNIDKALTKLKSSLDLGELETHLTKGYIKYSSLKEHKVKPLKGWADGNDYPIWVLSFGKSINRKHFYGATVFEAIHRARKWAKQTVKETKKAQKAVVASADVGGGY